MPSLRSGIRIGRRLSKGMSIERTKDRVTSIIVVLKFSLKAKVPLLDDAVLGVVCPYPDLNIDYCNSRHPLQGLNVAVLGNGISVKITANLCGSV